MSAQVKLKDEEVLSRLQQVCALESVTYDNSGLEAIIFTAEGDMRNALNSLAAPKNLTNSFRVRRYWKNGWYKTRLGVLNSWANIVAGYQHELGKMTIMPPVNLIKNIGNDGIGVHDNSNLYVAQEIQHIAIVDINWEIPSSAKVAMNDLKFEQEVFSVQSASILNSYLSYVRFKLKGTQKLFRLREK